MTGPAFVIIVPTGAKVFGLTRWSLTTLPRIGMRIIIIIIKKNSKKKKKKIIIIITDLYSAFRSEDTEALDAAQED